MLYNTHMLFYITCVMFCYITYVITGKNNQFPFLDILGYLKKTHKSPKFGRVRQVPTRVFPTKFPGWDLSWDFCGYSLNTPKYPKVGIGYFFLCMSCYIPYVMLCYIT